MAGKLPMGSKELIRVKVMEMVKQKQTTLQEGGKRLKVSYRQAKRIYARYKAEGDAGILHKGLGKPSNKRIDEAVRQTVLGTYRAVYEGFGPTLAAEKLAERERIEIGRETLRRWLIADGLWVPKKRKRKYHGRRERRSCFGELVQFDGSHHDWFEGRRGPCCLMNMVDDATGTTLSFLSEEETTEAAMQLLWAWIDRYGIPQAVYCDRKNAFVIDREPTIDEQLKDIVPVSPFETACARLGIEVIVAYSPEAKGRVERNHAVYQDRFVKELRLENISTIDEANRFLADRYLPAINNKFGKPPTSSEDAHVPLVDATDLREIFCFEEMRVLSRDHILQFERRLYRVPETLVPRPRPGGKVIIRKWLDGSLHFRWNNHPLLVEEFIIPKNQQEAARNPQSA